MSENKYHVAIPKETEWKEIWYHPTDIITRLSYGGDEYWKKQIPGCRIEVIEEDLEFMKHLVKDIKVKIIFPDNYQDMYVQPLADIHDKFWNFCMDQIIHIMYPFFHRNKDGRINGRSKKLWEIGSKIHSIVANIYWNMNYKDYTPQEWVKTLNNILILIENNKITDFKHLSMLENKIRKQVHGSI